MHKARALKGVWPKISRGGVCIGGHRLHRLRFYTLCAPPVPSNNVDRWDLVGRVIIRQTSSHRWRHEEREVSHGMTGRGLKQNQQDDDDDDRQ